MYHAGPALQLVAISTQDSIASHVGKLCKIACIFVFGGERMKIPLTAFSLFGKETETFIGKNHLKLT